MQKFVNILILYTFQKATLPLNINVFVYFLSANKYVNQIDLVLLREGMLFHLGSQKTPRTQVVAAAA